MILEYHIGDRALIDRRALVRITLPGDATHPMLEAECIAGLLSALPLVQAPKAYDEAQRLDDLQTARSAGHPGCERMNSFQRHRKSWPCRASTRSSKVSL